MDLKKGDRIRCVCGKEHTIVMMVGETPVIECPEAPPNMAYLIDPRRNIFPAAFADGAIVAIARVHPGSEN